MFLGRRARNLADSSSGCFCHISRIFCYLLRFIIKIGVLKALFNFLKRFTQTILFLLWSVLDSFLFSFKNSLRSLVRVIMNFCGLMLTKLELFTPTYFYYLEAGLSRIIKHSIEVRKFLKTLYCLHQLSLVHYSVQL